MFLIYPHLLQKRIRTEFCSSKKSIVFWGTSSQPSIRASLLDAAGRPPPTNRPQLYTVLDNLNGLVIVMYFVCCLMAYMC